VPNADGDVEPFAISLVVATRSRPDDVAIRIPFWTRAGFDEVIIVDASYDTAVRLRIEALCRQHGALYVSIAKTLKDLRSHQRNLGARQARGDWIFFQDDDDDVPVGVDKDALRKATNGKDWLAGPAGEHILWHRREAFLAFGGYPEDMVAAEDGIMSNRTRAHGRGGREPRWYRGTRDFPPPRADPISRMRNSFWYGYTVLLLFCRTPFRRDAFLGDVRRQWYQLRKAPREPWRLLSASIGAVARLLSPIHCVLVAVRSGPVALRQESYSPWQDVRST